VDWTDIRKLNGAPSLQAPRRRPLANLNGGAFSVDGLPSSPDHLTSSPDVAPSDFWSPFFIGGRARAGGAIQDGKPDCRWSGHASRFRVSRT